MTINNQTQVRPCGYPSLGTLVELTVGQIVRGKKFSHSFTMSML